jgi:anti-sigma factor RsiW
MDHETAVREMMTERYLLHELNPAEQDAFEEHFFECKECGDDVRAGSTFITYSQSELNEVPQPAERVSGRKRVREPWWGWLRPALTAPALALLLAVIGYQNLVTYPKLSEAVNQPLIGPWVSVNVGTRGAEAKLVQARAGEGFGVLLDIPPQDGFRSYRVDLYNPTGKLEWSGQIPTAPAEENRQIYIPGRNRQPGTYTLVVNGINPAGESKELSRHPIDLQIQK